MRRSRAVPPLVSGDWLDLTVLRQLADVSIDTSPLPFYDSLGTLEVVAPDGVVIGAESVYPGYYYYYLPLRL